MRLQINNNNNNSTRKTLIRPNIQKLKPYASDRNTCDFQAIFLDSNETAYPLPENLNYFRYPDESQTELRKALSGYFEVKSENIMVTNGSDEAIDILIRTICEPGTDNIVAMAPSFQMYSVYAAINNVEFREVMLNEDFSVDSEKILQTADKQTKLIMLCNPNNPSGTLMYPESILEIARRFNGIVLVDEAYIEFSGVGSMTSKISEYDNILVTRTFSKAGGLAGLRAGAAIGNAELIGYMDRVRSPYNVNSFTTRKVLDFLKNKEKNAKSVARIIESREFLTNKISEFSFVERVFPSGANFILIRFRDAGDLCSFLKARKIFVKDRSQIPLCENCIRISVGNDFENQVLLNTLSDYEKGIFSVLENTPDAIVSGRSVVLKRTTSETSVIVGLDLDGEGKTDISTGIGFFDHMLDQLVRHSGCNLTINVIGDTEIDEHHTVEDTALLLGKAFAMALGNKTGIERYGFTLPMDDCLASTAIDFGGRPWLEWDVKFIREKIGDMATEMFFHFFKSFSDNAKCNLNISAKGENEHHKAEAVFKAFARTIKQAIKKSGDGLPSTKGTL